MGFFGLFVSIIGLGAMTKDAISNSIFEQRSYEDSVRKGYSTFFTGNGSQRRSVKTGRLCTERMDYTTHHNWLVDSKTGEKIEDITDRINREREMEIKRKAYDKGIKFYRTTRFDCQPRYRSDVYINDDMPGKFFDWDPINDKYKEGRLIDSIVGNGKKVVDTDINNRIYYKPDGTIIK